MRAKNNKERSNVLSTIKQKLIFLLAIIFLGFSAIGLEILKESNDAKMAATRLTNIAEIENLMLELRIQQRDFQLYFKQKNFDGYEQSYQKLQKDLEDLKAILMSPKNHERISNLQKLLYEWHEVNVPRMQLFKQYTFAIHDPNFAQSHPEDAKKLNDEPLADYCKQPII